MTNLVLAARRAVGPVLAWCPAPLPRLSGRPYLPIGILAVVVVVAVLADWLAPADPLRQNLRSALRPPSGAYPFGTDALGRDLLSRVVHGARISVVVGLASVALAAAVGVAIGLVAATLRGWAGEALMRVTDMALTLPAVLIALAAAATVGPSTTNVILIIGLLYWAHFARMVRAEALGIRQREFVTAARAMGASPVRILLRHVLPNVVNTVIVVATLQLAAAILLESTLSFLGVGVPPPTPTWGTTVAEGRSYIASAWWIVTVPGLAIMLTVLSINLLGDWLRDRFDPRLRTL